MTDGYIISPANQILFKDTVLKYLNGTYDAEETRNSMLSACKYQSHRITAKELAKSIELSIENDPILDPKIAEILTYLKVNTDKSYHVKNGTLSLYALLRDQQDKQIDYLLEMIDEAEPPAPLFNYIYRPTLGIIGLLSFSYVQPQYFWLAIDWITEITPVTYYWLQHYVVQLNNWPIIGMGMQGAWLLYYLYYTFQHGYDPSTERLRNLSFRALSLTLTFLGHFLAYSAAGALSWGPALFFIAGSMVSIVESIHFYATQDRNKPTAGPDPHSKALEIRHKKKLDRNFYYFLVRLIHAIAITALLIICSLLPPSLILTMVYTLTLSLSYLLKDVLIEHIKYTFANDEQTAVAEHYRAIENTLEKKMKEEKGKFLIEANEIIQTYREEPEKQNALREVMDNLLANDPFSLKAAKNSFKQFEFFGNRLSPSPSHANSQFGFYHQQSPRRTPQRRLSSSAAYTTPMQLTSNDSVLLERDSDLEALTVRGGTIPTYK